MKGEHPVRLLCELLAVSRSGYYHWQERRPTKRQQEDARLAEKIAAAHTRSRKNYGAPRIVEELREEGTPISKRRCARLMKARGLQGRKKHRRRPRTTDSRHAHAPAENLLAKTPAQTGPNQAWMTDITYLETGEGWLYLAAILDVWSRRVVGWACGPTLHVSLVLVALQAALRQRKPPQGPAASLRPRRAIRLQRLRRRAQRRRLGLQHEPPRQLLRQRRDGVILEHVEDRDRP